MHLTAIALTALKVAILAGWVHLTLLLVRSLRPASNNRTVYLFRLYAALLGGGALVQGTVLVVRSAALDGQLSPAVAVWGGWLWVEGPVSLLLAVVTVLLVRLMLSRSYTVIDEALREVRRLRVEAGTDPLTGLANRMALDQRMSDLVATGDPLTVIFADVDDFKKYNDTYGHLAGDLVLRSLAGVMLRSVRRSDVVSRYGGEEFVILLPGARSEIGRGIAEHIRRAVAEEPFPNRQITLSIGVAAAPADATDPAALLRLADEAMYRAKSEGGNRVYDCTRASSAS